MSRFFVAALVGPDDHSNAVNVGIGISLCGPQRQWSIGLGQSHPSFQGPERCNARLYRRGRKSPGALLSYRLLPVK
jgi:hypothetical protein